jgi:hypothetical protein
MLFQNTRKSKFKKNVRKTLILYKYFYLVGFTKFLAYEND